MMNSEEKRPSVPREGTRLRAMRKAGDVAGLIRELENSQEEHGQVRNIAVCHSVRGRAAYELGKLRASEAVQPVVRLLDDPEPSVRAYAANSLGRLGDGRAGESLMGLLEDANENVVSCAIRSLGRLKFKPAVSPLIPVLDHPNVRMRVITATALSRIGDMRAMAPLKDAVKKSCWRHPVTSGRLIVAMVGLGFRR